MKERRKGNVKTVVSPETVLKIRVKWEDCVCPMLVSLQLPKTLPIYIHFSVKGVYYMLLISAPGRFSFEIYLALAAIALYCSGWGWTSRTLEWGNLFFSVLFHYFMLVNGWPSCSLVSSSVYLQTKSWFKRFISLFHQLCSTTHYFACSWEIREREGNSPPILTTEVILYKVE